MRPTLVRLGELALDQRRLDDAEGLFRRVLELESDSAAAWFGLGQVAVERRDAAAAIEAFERVLSLQPDASIAHYPLALAYRDGGDAERAKEHLALRGEGAVRSRDPLVRELTTLSKLSALQVVLSQAADPQVAARDLVGFAVGQLAGVEGAADYLRAAIEQRPAGEQTLAPLARSRVLDVVGALLVEQGRLDDAARAFEQALAVAPDFADAAVRLGNLLGRQRRFSAALDRYDAVLAREPRNAEALLGRADALAFLGRDVEAFGVARASGGDRARAGDASCSAPPPRSSGWGGPTRRWPGTARRPRSPPTTPGRHRAGRDRTTARGARRRPGRARRAVGGGAPRSDRGGGAPRAGGAGSQAAALPASGAALRRGGGARWSNEAARVGEASALLLAGRMGAGARAARGRSAAAAWIDHAPSPAGQAAGGLSGPRVA